MISLGSQGRQGPGHYVFPVEPEDGRAALGNMGFQAYQSGRGRLGRSGPLGIPLRQVMETPARASGASPGCWESAFPPLPVDIQSTGPTGLQRSFLGDVRVRLPLSLASFWLAAYTFKKFVSFYTHPGGPGAGSDGISIQ